MDVKEVLLDQLRWYWENMLMPRLEGLTDDEYLWEPVSGCWTIRRSADGVWQRDRGHPIPPEPEPLTTIAWRMEHIAEMCMRRAANQFGTEGYVHDTQGTAENAVQRMRSGYAAWQGNLEDLPPAEFARPIGPSEAHSGYEDHPLGSLALHMSREIIHHGAEVALLRDLYIHTQLSRPDVQALLSGELPAAADLDRLRANYPDLVTQAVQQGSAAAVRVLVEHGFDVNASVRRPALHAAAAKGDIGMCKLLIDLGADVAQRDGVWNQTALGWARFCKQDEAAAYLEPLTPTG